ncbi:hypothetical protein Daus18300_010416 [Diaporthe australafricana]|uniref:Uncharacterized protein n=1 Tax=Diaporthe australafricana TaxID=127596 RepID=A0ABR3WAQ3_9PEZI
MCCATSETFYCGECWRAQPGGKWSSSNTNSQIKFAPKSKRGKAAGRREEMEKFKSLGLVSLEQAFNSGEVRPEHAQFSGHDSCRRVSRKQLALHIRVAGRAPRPKAENHRRSAQRAVLAGLLGYEDHKMQEEHFNTVCYEPCCYDEFEAMLSIFFTEEEAEEIRAEERMEDEQLLSGYSTE